jgi:hypothetical protein
MVVRCRVEEMGMRRGVDREPRPPRDSRSPTHLLPVFAVLVLALNLVAWVLWGVSCDLDAVRITPGSARDHACSNFKGPDRIDWVLFVPVALAFVGALVGTATDKRALGTGIALGALVPLLIVFLMPEVFSS